MFFLVFAIHLLFLTKISWCLQSFSDQDRKDKKKAERLLKIDEVKLIYTNLLEIRISNGKWLINLERG